MKFLTLLILCIGLPVLGYTQALNTNTVFESGGSQNDQARSIVVEPKTNNRYIINRTLSDDGDISGSNGGWDAWIIKLDANNDTLWTRVFGGSGSDMPVDGRLDGDDLVVVGQTNSEDGDLSSSSGGQDGWIFKLNSAGDLLWSNKFGGTNPDKFLAITNHKNGGYVVVGNSSSVDGDLPLRNVSTTSAAVGWVAHIDTAGSLLSSDYVSASTDSDYIDEMMDVITMPDGYYIVGNTGHFTILSTNDIWVVKLNNQLNPGSEAFFGGTDSDYGVSIHRVPGKFEFIVTGQTYSNDGDMLDQTGALDFWAARLVGAGSGFSIVSSNSIGGTNVDQLRTTAADDSTVYLFGMSRSTNGDRINGNPANGNDAWLVAIDYDCKVRYQASFGGTASDIGAAIATAQCGELILGVEMESANGDATVNQGNDDLWIGGFGNAVSADFLTDNFSEGDTGDLEIALDYPVLGESLGVSVTAAAGANNGAVPNLDYPPLDTTVRIEAGETSVIVPFPTLRDADIEGTETVSLGYSIGPIVGCPTIAGELTVELNEGPLSRHELHIKGLRLGPNPTAGSLHVSRTSTRNLSYTLSGIDGRSLQSGTWQGKQLDIDCSTYAAGTYFLRLSEGKAVSSYRIIKQ